MPLTLPNTRPGLMAKFAIGMDHALADGNTGDVDAIHRGRELEVVADVHRRDQEAQLARELAAHTAHSGQQITTLLRIHQRAPVGTDFETQQVDRRTSSQESSRDSGAMTGATSVFAAAARRRLSPIPRQPSSASCALQ